MPQLNIEWFASQLFWLIICFMSFWFIMAKFIAPKISGIMKERQNKIDDYLEEAKGLKDRAEVSLQKYQAALKKAQEESAAAIEKNRLDLNKLLADKQDELRKKVDKEIAAAEKDIDKHKTEAKKQVKAMATELAWDILQKLKLNHIKQEKLQNIISKNMG